MREDVTRSGEPDWWRPATPGHPAAIDSLTVVAAPLLAGFSITLIGVIAQAVPMFLLPGPAILVLTGAAVALVLCIQCGFWARQHLATPADFAAWQVTADDELKRAQAEQGVAYEAWRTRSAVCYEAGVVALTLGVGLAVLPTEVDSAGTAVFRWISFGMVMLMLLFSAFWIMGDRLARVPLVNRSSLVRKAALAWLYPAHRILAERERTGSADGRE